MSDYQPWKKRIRLSERLRYAVDYLLTAGAGMQVILLVALALLPFFLAVIFLAVRFFLETQQTVLNFGDAFLSALERTFDVVTLGSGYSPLFRLLLTAGGVLFIAALAAIFNAGIQARLIRLQRGHTRVIEKNHFVILGWSEQIFIILNELILANEDTRNPCIVILAEHDKLDMEEEIRQKVRYHGRTRILCRTGSPMDIDDLSILSLNRARAVIILSPETEDPDSEVIRIAMAVINHPANDPRMPRHVVAQIRNPQNMEIAHAAGRAGVEWIEVGKFIGRLIARTCRQSGLGIVYTELLNFAGDNFYFDRVEELAGKTFGEVLPLFEKACVMGVAPGGGAPIINPSMKRVLQTGDELVVYCDDEDELDSESGKPGLLHKEDIRLQTAQELRAEHTLLLGWNWRAPVILQEMDPHVAPGSDVLVLADQQGAEYQLQRAAADLRNQKTTFKRADTTDRNTLNNLSLGRFDHIILLCYSDILSTQKADAKTLVTLLHLREIVELQGYELPIVSEMLDIRNRDLADVITRPDDFIVSDQIVSMQVSQAAQNKYINGVFVDLFNPEGSEVYLKPAGDYVVIGKPVNFYAVIESARMREEVAIGYRLSVFGRDQSHNFGVVINPEKSQTVTFSSDDRIIVLAED